MTIMTAPMTVETTAFYEALPQELRDLIDRAELTWSELAELLDPRVFVAGPSWM